MPCKITSISYALPQKRLTHEQLCERFGKSVMDKVAAVSGIYERRIADETQCASDFAFVAANAILGEDARKSVDMLIFGTQTPDYLLPTTACILQHRLGLSKNSIAFDINLGCTQFLYALSTAKAYIDAHMAKKVLVLCGDTPTRLINPKDKSALALFSDAGSACIVEESARGEILDFVFGVDGKNYADLICPASGMRRRNIPEDSEEKTDEYGNTRSNQNLYINGFKIFAFAYKIIPCAVEEVLKKNSLTKADIDLFVFHQAGEKIVSAAAQRLKLPPKKVYMDMREIGNCGGSSIPVALADAATRGLIGKGSKILLCAFGVGLSWAATVVEFSGTPKTVREAPLEI